MSTQDNLHLDIMDATIALAKKNNTPLPSWFCNEEGDIVHPALCNSLPNIDEDWWSKKSPVTISLLVSPEIRIEDEYYVLLIDEDVKTVTRINNRNIRSAVMEPQKWIDIAHMSISAKDRHTVQITAVINPSQGGNTLFREISSVTYDLIKN